jgi:MarR family transcriptional regulator, organic hydroperoxide resistance regulator
VPSPEDKRKVVLTLTPRGDEAARQVAEIESALYAMLTAVIPDQQIETLLPVLWNVVAGRPAGEALARRLQRLPLSSQEEEDNAHD